jgi:2-methylcitrate dehydratase PrpD
MALPLQFANAARGALHAVDLVANGLTGPHDPLEGPFGHFALFDHGDLATYTAKLGTWRIAELSTKPFPSGRASHAMLGALAALQGQKVTAIDAYVPPLIRHLMDRPMHSQMTPAYARLCLPFLIALMLRDGVIDPRAFTSETFADSGLAAVASSVRILDDGNPDPNAMAPQRVEVSLASGEKRSIAIPATLGSPGQPLSVAEAAAKYDLCRALAPQSCDPRLFSDPLAYLVNA